MKIESGLTLSESIKDGNLISQLKRQDEAELTKQVFMIVKRFCNLVNVGKGMNEDQMITLATDLIESFQNGETLEDIILFFKMARKGEFGQFNRLDTVVIMGWLPKFLDCKAQEREKLIYNWKARQVQDAKNIKKLPGEAKEKFEELSEKLTIPKEKPTNHLTQWTVESMRNYNAYLKTLPEAIKKLTDKQLAKELENTSKFSHPEAWEIISKEKQLRSKEKESRKNKI